MRAPRTQTVPILGGSDEMYDRIRTVLRLPAVIQMKVESSAGGVSLSVTRYVDETEAVIPDMALDSHLGATFLIDRVDMEPLDFQPGEVLHEQLLVACSILESKGVRPIAILVGDLVSAADLLKLPDGSRAYMGLLLVGGSPTEDKLVVLGSTSTYLAECTQGVIVDIGVSDG